MLMAGLVMVVGIIITFKMNENRRPVPADKPAVPGNSATPAPVVSSRPEIPAEIAVPAPVPPLHPATSGVAVITAPPPGIVPTGQPLIINGYVVQDPEARAALSFVGADPAADAYWADAISDPTLPAEERKDLIEDLNEDGLSDPHHPGPADLPLIMARLRLIEELGPYAMDQVNADAFAEAEKDLIGMANGQSPQ